MLTSLVSFAAEPTPANVAYEPDHRAPVTFDDLVKIGRHLSHDATRTMEQVLAATAASEAKQTRQSFPAKAMGRGLLFVQLVEKGDPAARLYLQKFQKLASIDAELAKDDDALSKEKRAELKNERTTLLSSMNAERRRLLAKQFANDRAPLEFVQSMQVFDIPSEEAAKGLAPKHGKDANLGESIQIPAFNQIYGRAGTYNGHDILVHTRQGKTEYYLFYPGVYAADGKTQIVMTRIETKVPQISSLRSSDDPSARTAYNAHELSLFNQID